MEDIGVTGVILIVVLIVLLVAGLLWGAPKWRVYQRELRGQAALREAEWSRQIQIEEAKGKLEASKLLAQAEAQRARGVAEANEIIGQSLAGNEAYLRYLWIQGLHDGNGEVVYVPTEANLPILEATRSLQPQPASP